MRTGSERGFGEIEEGTRQSAALPFTCKHRSKGPTEYGGYEGETEAMPEEMMHHLLAALQRAPATCASYSRKTVRQDT